MNSKSVVWIVLKDSFLLSSPIFIIKKTFGAHVKHIYSFIFILFFCSVSYSQNPCPGVQTVDYGSKTYHTVQISNQCWLKENLDIGTMINMWHDQINNDFIEKHCYNNDHENCKKYGGLYQWNEAMQYNSTLSAQGICPKGWHIPTKREFDILAGNYGGNALKEVDQGSEKGVGTNASGFSALLSGMSVTTETFGTLGKGAFLWSSTESSNTHAYNMNLYCKEDDIMFIKILKGTASSVRCIKD